VLAADYVVQDPVPAGITRSRCRTQTQRRVRTRWDGGSDRRPARGSDKPFERARKASSFLGWNGFPELTDDAADRRYRYPASDVARLRSSQPLTAPCNAIGWLDGVGLRPGPASPTTERAMVAGAHQDSLLIPWSTGSDSWAVPSLKSDSKPAVSAPSICSPLDRRGKHDGEGATRVLKD
jgi:hypothetical protein